MVEKLQHSIGFEGALVVETQGHSGGIALSWRYKGEVMLSAYNKNHIDVYKNHIDVKVSTREGYNFRLTGLYGEPNRSKRMETWDLVRCLSTNNSLPWCLIDDMNNVISQNDKKGDRPYPSILFTVLGMS